MYGRPCSSINTSTAQTSHSTPARKATKNTKPPSPTSSTTTTSAATSSLTTSTKATKSQKNRFIGSGRRSSPISSCHSEYFESDLRYWQSSSFSQSRSYYSSTYQVQPSAYWMEVTVTLQCLPPRVMVRDFVVFFLMTRYYYYWCVGCCWDFFGSYFCTSFCTSLVLSFFPCCCTALACSIASLLSLTPSPTFTTKQSSPTAPPTTFSTGLSSFLLAVLFLSPSPTNSSMIIFVQVSSQLRFMMILLMPSAAEQYFLTRVRQFVCCFCWPYQRDSSQRTWSEAAVHRPYESFRAGIGYCYQSSEIRSWQASLPYLVLRITLSLTRVLSYLNLPISVLSALIMDFGSFLILFNSTTSSFPLSVQTILFPFTCSFSSPAPPTPPPPSLLQNFPVSAKYIGTNDPCFSLATTPPKCVKVGWNNVILFPFFSSPSPTISPITSSLSVELTSLSLTLKLVLASQLQRDLSSLKGLGSEVVRIERQAQAVQPSSGDQVSGGLGLERQRQRMASCHADLPQRTRSLSPLRVRMTLLDSKRASCCLMSSMQS